MTKTKTTRHATGLKWTRNPPRQLPPANGDLWYHEYRSGDYFIVRNGPRDHCPLWCRWTLHLNAGDDESTRNFKTLREAKAAAEEHAAAARTWQARADYDGNTGETK